MSGERMAAREAPLVVPRGTGQVRWGQLPLTRRRAGPLEIGKRWWLRGGPRLLGWNVFLANRRECSEVGASGAKSAAGPATSSDRAVQVERVLERPSSGSQARVGPREGGAAPLGEGSMGPCPGPSQEEERRDRGAVLD